MYILTQEEYDALKGEKSQEISELKKQIVDNNIKYLKELLEYFKEYYESSMYNNYRPITFEQGIININNKYKL